MTRGKKQKQAEISHDKMKAGHDPITAWAHSDPHQSNGDAEARDCGSGQLPAFPGLQGKSCECPRHGEVGGARDLDKGEREGVLRMQHGQRADVVMHYWRRPPVAAEQSRWRVANLSGWRDCGRDAA